MLETEKLIVPLLEPLDPEVIVIKLSLATAFQLQLPGAVTVKLPVPPEFGKFWLAELSDVAQALPSKKVAILGYEILNRP